MLRLLRSLFVFLAVAAFTLLAGCDLSGWASRSDPGPGPTTGAAPKPSTRTTAPSARPADLPSRPAPAAASDPSGPQFAPGQLERHFEKHGAEMGITSQDEYLRRAQAMVRGGPGIESFRRGDDTLFFKESTNEFAVLSGRGVIRTYFQPSDGRRYWERQKRR